MPTRVTTTATPLSSIAVCANASGSTFWATCTSVELSPCSAMTARATMGEATSAAASPVAMTSRRSDALIDERPALGAPGGIAARPAGTGLKANFSRGFLPVSVIEAGLVDEFARGLAVLRDRGKRKAVGLDRAEKLLGVAVGDARADRIFVVRVRRHRLRGVRCHEGDQLHGLGLVGRVLGDRSARDVHVRATAGEA